MQKPQVASCSRKIALKQAAGVSPGLPKANISSQLILVKQPSLTTTPRLPRGSYLTLTHLFVFLLNRPLVTARHTPLFH